MPLEDCPHMKAVCPVKQDNCTSDGHDCHFVLSTVGSTVQAIESIDTQLNARFAAGKDTLALTRLRDQFVTVLESFDEELAMQYRRIR